jgi:hypothetical protein
MRKDIVKVIITSIICGTLIKITKIIFGVDQDEIDSGVCVHIITDGNINGDKDGDKKPKTESKGS